MAVQVSYPGVYVEEFAPGAPIEGVGTSTAAFIGLASDGPLDSPIKLTSFDDFRATFGEQPRPGVFLWYAVRGFFETGGQVCYVVRASNGDYDRWDVPDRSGIAGNFAFRARARHPGVSGITLDVAASSLLPAPAELFRAAAATVASVAGRDVVIGAGEGARFRPGDLVSITGLPNPVQIVRVTGATTGDTLRVGSDLSPVPASGAQVVLADAVAGTTRTVRIHSAVNPLPSNALVPGTMLTIDASA